MKKMNFNKKLATALSFVAFGVTGLGVATVDASAADTPFTMDQVSVSMWEGASVRIPDATYTLGGLRYTMEMSVEDYELLIANVGEGKTYSNVEFGVFVAPEYYNEKKVIANETNLKNAYGWLTEAEKEAGTSYENSVARQKGLVQIINTQNIALTDAINGEQEKVKVFYGSVVDMWQDNMLEEYIGIGYIRYTDANGTYYKFATANDNVRSMTYVAQCAIDDNKDTSGTLNTTYVTPFADTETDYTVDYYFRNESGDYVKNETVKASETVSSTVGATVIPEQTAIDGYTAVEAKAESGKVYANGKSSFGLYYRNETNLYDFETDEAVTTGFWINGTTEESEITVVSAPGREKDTALCLEDKGTASTAYICFGGNLSRTALQAISKYDMINFDIYVEAEADIAFFPYTGDNNASGLTGTLSANQWKTYSVRLTDIKNGNNDYLRFWAGTTGYKVYISNITLSEWSYDWDTQIFTGDITLTANDRNATTSVVADPTNSGRGNVYKWADDSMTAGGSYNTSASWSNIATYVEWAKAAGYDSFSIDVYRSASCGGTSIHINGWNFVQTKTGEWETITVNLYAPNSGSNLMWIQNDGGGYILFDNFRFEKLFKETVFDGENSLITMTSSKGTFSVIDDPTDSGKGKVYSYVAGSDTYDTGVQITGLTDLVRTAIALGYKQLTLEVYITQTPWAIDFLTNSSNVGSSVMPAQTGVWTPISIDLSTMNLTDGTDKAKIHFKDKSLDNRVYFDNICFTK